MATLSEKEAKDVVKDILPIIRYETKEFYYEKR